MTCFVVLVMDGLDMGIMLISCELCDVMLELNDRNTSVNGLNCVHSTSEWKECLK